MHAVQEKNHSFYYHADLRLFQPKFTLLLVKIIIYSIVSTFDIETFEIKEMYEATNTNITQYHSRKVMHVNVLVM